MAAMMRNWITPTVEDQFSMACDALQPQYTPGQHLEKYPYICRKEALSIHLTGGRCVQVIDILDRPQECSDFEVVLSDATTKLHATFTSISTAEFPSVREFTDYVLGAVLGISDFYLTYNPNSPPAERLVLRVTKFKLLGCLGEKPFGRPVDIEEQESLCDILSRLDDLLSNNTREPDDELDIQSQAGDMDDLESSPIAMTSQVAFSTQIPGKAVVSKAPSFSKGSDLLALLKKPKAAARTTVNAQTALQPVSDSRRAEISSRLDSKVNSQSSLPPSGSKDYALAPNEPNSTPDDDSEKENSQESLNKEKVLMSTTRSNETQSVVEVQEENASELYATIIPEGNPFEGMKRVPRSYVRIPENQQALLDQKDSWYQPEAGDRPSYANIPTDVLQDLKQHVGRIQHGRKLHSTQQTESETAESSDSIDEDSDVEEEAKVYEDAYRKVDDTKETPHLPKESVSTSDEDSVYSWSESDHGDIEPINTKVAPGSSPIKGLNIEPFRANNNLASMATNLPLEHNSGTPRPVVSNRPLLPKLNAKIDYNFPSSSPGDEQELEIAVPYALDDEVEVDDQEIAEEPETSQELPSTAMQNKPVIQVEQTPDHNVREGQELGSGNKPDPKLHPRFFKGAKNASEDISSDPIIPATFHNPSSQDRLPASKLGPPSSDKRINSATSSNGYQLYTLQESVPIVKDDDAIDEEDEMAEEQLFAELKGSQHQRGQPIESSPVRHPSPPLETFTSPTPTRPESNNLPQNVSPLLRSPQQPASSSLHTALSEMRTEYEKPTTKGDSPAKSEFAESVNEVPQHETRKLKKGPLRQSLAAAASQGDGTVRNTIELVKAARHSFHVRHSTPLEEPPVVQIAQSQPKSTASKQSSPARQFADEIFPQSSNDCVRSSVPERTEKSTTFEYTTEELAAIASISREQSPPAGFEGSHPSQAAEIREISGSRRLPLLERLEFANDLDIIEPPANSERFLPSKTTQIASSSGSAKLSVLKSLEVAGDLNIARTALVDPKGDLPDLQKRFANRTARPEVEDDVEIMSISSNSEELLVDEGELADEDELVGDAALLNEKDQQLAYVREAIRERYPPEPNHNDLAGENASADEKELVQEEEVSTEDQPTYKMETSRERNYYSEPTAFERFKSVYPSYSGREKDFVWALVYIEWLVQSKGDDFLRASLWDDLIRTLAAEFLEYMREARKSQLPRDKIKTGFAYFNKLDKPPIFQNRVITPDTLQDCLLTLDADQVQTTRSIFSKSIPSLTDHPRPESSHGPPSVASKHSQTDQANGKSVANTLTDIAGPSEPDIIPEPRPLKGSERATLKRPFFETPSQLQSAKRTFIPGSPDVQNAGVDIPRPSRNRRSLPWGQQSSPAPTTGDRPAISAPTSSSRIHSTTTKPKVMRRPTSSASFTGSPASPILGEAEPATRSFSAIDIRTGSIGSATLHKFKIPSAPISKASLQQRSISSRSNEKSKVEGWLDQNPSPVNPNKLRRKESMKRKRDSGLELLDMRTPVSSSGTASTKRPKAAPAMPSAPSSSIASGQGVRKKTSFRDFLKQRRASGLASSTPESASSAKRTAAYVEPETQAWGA